MHGGEDEDRDGKQDVKTIEFSRRSEVFFFFLWKAEHCAWCEMQSDESLMSLINGRAK